MSISSRITSIEGHIEDDYNALTRLGADLTGVDKNIENIASVVNDIYDKLPKVTGTGSDLSLTPTLQAKMNILPIGNAEQDTYTGKNLCELNAYPCILTATYIVATSLTSVTSPYTTLQNYRGVGFVAKVEQGKTYTFSSNISGYNYSNVVGIYETKTDILDNTKQLEILSGATFTPNYSGYAFIGGSTNASGSIITWSWVQLEEGSTATSYEPYVGGIPAPNPDYPQDIRVVTDNLPNEYQEVEYIESSGTQYIDTGFNGGNNYSIKFKTYDSVVSKFPFSDFNNSVANENIGWYVSSGNKYAVYHTSTNNILEIATGNVVEVELQLSSTGLNCKYNGQTTSISYTPVTTNGNVVLFRRGNLDQYYSTTKLYYFKIYNSSNVLVRDLVPCYRISDNVIGLYDKVNNEFYINQGTGTFAKGNDVNSIVVCNKNIFDSTIEQGGINTDTGADQTSYGYVRCNYVKVIGGETISVKYKNDLVERGQVVIYEYDKNKNYLGFHYGNAKNYTRTLLSNTVFIRLRLEGENPAQVTSFSEIQVEYNDTPTSYVAHQEQSTTLHLENTYLASIPNTDYKDEIDVVNKKIIRKVGKKIANNITTTGTTNVHIDTTFNDYLNQNGLCNYLINKVDSRIIGNYDAGVYLENNEFSFRDGTTKDRLYIKSTLTATELNALEMTVYYVLATPTEETITDTTLINELNGLQELLSYDGTTNITITSDSDNAQMIVEVSALKGE